jgi:3-hydroxyisobutyrate dehydrogenase-like beta-hydroxyacid dehydrogenase
MRIGIAGAGKMGRALAENLLGHGHTVRVWDRATERVRDLAGRGAEAAASPEALVDGMDVVLVMLWGDDAAREVSLGRIIPAAAPPTVVVEMSTLSPEMYRTLGRAAEAKGLDFVASPVLGSVDLARGGKLIVLPSGSETVVARVRDVLGAFGTVTYVGPTGSSAYLKLANNAIIGIVAESLRELLAFCAHGGIAEDVAVDSLTGAFGRIAGSKVAQLHAHDTEPRFSLDALHKDLLLACQAGAAAGVPLPLLETVVSSVEAGIAHGLGERDYIAIVGT